MAVLINVSFLANRLLLMVIPLLNELEIPDDVEARKRIISFHDDPSVCKLVQNVMLDFLLLTYRYDLQINHSNLINNSFYLLVKDIL